MDKSGEAEVGGMPTRTSGDGLIQPNPGSSPGSASSAATDREFLTDVRTRASDVLTKDICALDAEADPADVHEDVREALWPFFLEIRDRFGVEGDV